MDGYSVRVIESSRKLTAKERIQLKNFDSFLSLDDLIPDDGSGIKLEIEPVDYAVVEVHNEKSDNKDYFKYIIFAKNGDIYITGSEPFFTTFKDIFSEMIDAVSDGEVEDWGISVYRRESKNYKGKTFFTCSVI